MSDESVGSASVEIVPDARGFSEKLKAQIRDARVTVNVDANTAEARADIDETARTRDAKIKPEVDQFSRDKANAELDTVARTRTARIKVKADTSEAETALAGLRSSAGKVWDKKFPILLGAAASTLGPLGGAAVGGGLALGATAGAGLLGGGLVAALAKSQATQLQQTSQQLQTLQAAVTNATTVKQHQQALLAYAKAYDQLTASQKLYINSERSLSATWNTLGQTTLPLLAQGSHLLADILPKTQPLVDATSASISKWLTALDEGAQKPGFQKFIDGLANMSGQSLDRLGPSFGNIGTGLAGLFSAFSPDGISMLDSFQHETQKFSDWANSPGVHHFVDYVNEHGPLVAHTIGDLSKAFVDLFSAASPVGDVVLHAVDGIAKLIDLADKHGGLGKDAIDAAGLALGGYTAYKLASKVPGVKNLLPGGDSAGLGGKGVTDVYVVNMPGGGLGGGSGLPGAAGDAEKAGKSGKAAGALKKFGGLATLGSWGPLALMGALGVDSLQTSIHDEGGFSKWITGTSGLPSFLHGLTPGTSPNFAAGNFPNALASTSTQKQNILSTFDVNTDPANAKLNILGGHLDQLKKPAVVPIDANISAFLDKVGIVTQQKGAIAGAIFAATTNPTAPGHAGGGPIAGPGTGTSDSILLPVSNGEYVVNAQSTAKNRALLEYINKYGHASGGLVDPTQLGSMPWNYTPSTSKLKNGLPTISGQTIVSAQDSFILSEPGAQQTAAQQIAAAFDAFQKSVLRVNPAFEQLKKAAMDNATAYEAVNKQLTMAEQVQAGHMAAAGQTFQHNIFGSSLDYMRMQLGDDINQSDAFRGAIKAAQAKGLSGSFGAELASSGNLQLAQQFAGADAATIQQMQALYSRRNAGSGDLVTNITAGFEQSGINAMNATLADLAAQMAAINAEARSVPMSAQQAQQVDTIRRAMGGMIVAVQPVGGTGLRTN